MSQHIRANAFLLVFSIGLSAVAYPLVLWVFGQGLVPEKAEGSLVYDQSGNVIGSRLIAQPFAGDEYFHPRPSAVGYNAASTAGSNWGGNNYLLRDRVARALGPLVKYAAGESKGQPVGPDVEAWLSVDEFGGKKGLVAQWAELHATLAANWVKADPLNADYVSKWAEAHPSDVDAWKQANAGTEPTPDALAVAFFTSFSSDHPGTFPVAVETQTADGKTEKVIQPAEHAADIQSIFFDMWRQEHPGAELENVPADLVMASGAGLDPDITLKNALFQLDRIAARRAQDAGLPEAKVREAIAAMLRSMAVQPLGGLAGTSLVNVLEANLALPDVLAKLGDSKVADAR